MPFLLLCGMGFSAFFASLGTLIFIPMALVMLLGDGPFRSNDVVVDKATFLADAAPLLIIFPIVLAAYGTVAYGLWKERRWTRTVIMGFWAVLFAGMVGVAVFVPSGDQNVVGSLISFLFMWGIAAWYCYGKRSVLEYYQAIEAQEASRSPTGPGVAPTPEAS
jgi:hypothetical protein